MKTILLFLACTALVGCDAHDCAKTGHVFERWSLKEEFAGTPTKQIRRCIYCGLYEEMPIAKPEGIEK